MAPSKQTVRDFLEVWIDTIKPEVALKAWTNYGEVVERYVLPYLGSTRLADLSAMDVMRWHGTLLDHGRRDGKPLAVNSVKLAHRVLHRALADGVRWNVLPTNPARSVRVPTGEHIEMTVWSSDEARRFIESLAEDRLRGLWTLALHTGMRRGELAGTVGVLRDHLERQEVERLAVGVAWANSGYVFVDEAGVPLLPQRLTKMFASAIARVEVPKIRLHDVRHTMATSALEAGVHPKVVQEQLGHATIAVTMDTYSHVPQAVRRESAGRIAGLFE